MVVNRERVVIADTNIISYAFKRVPLAQQYSRLLIGREIRISFVTVGELHRWAEKNGWGARRRLELRLFLARFPVIPCTPGIPELYAQIMVERERAGEPILSHDAWIAATAMFHDFPLVTHDANILKTRGVRVISANPEVALLKAANITGRTPLDMDARCNCSF
jgi:predicted nucleic acid-binding protein